MIETRRNVCAPTVVGSLDRGPLPSFSVVIAAYQAADTIAEAIDSALTQTHAPLEVIVSDDGSTDATAAVLDAYADRIVVVRKERGGEASARNAALAVARGDFVAVLDADDAYHPERLEALAELAVARPDLDILCTDALLEVDGRVVERFGRGCPFAVDDQRAAILERCFCIASAYRRTKLVAVDGFDESLRTGSDWDCLIRLFFDAGAAAGLVDEPLYRYRLHERSLTADRIRTLHDRIVLLDRARERPDLSGTERAALRRSLERQRSLLVLAEAEAALRGNAADARRRALAVVRAPAVPLRSRASGLAAALAPRAAGWALERRAARGRRSRLDRSVRLEHTGTG